MGRVVEVGNDVTDVHRGEVIWGTWGHRGSTVKSADYVRARVLDPEAPTDTGYLFADYSYRAEHGP